MDYKIEIMKFTKNEFYANQVNSICKSKFIDLTTKSEKSSKKVMQPDAANEQIFKAIGLYVPLEINFKNVSVMPQRVDIDVNGWMEILGRAGYMVHANFIMPDDNISEFNEAGFTKEPPVAYHNRNGKKYTSEEIFKNCIGVYAYAYDKKTGFFTGVEYINKDEVEKLFAASKAQYVWKSYPGEMLKKSVIRRLRKRLNIEDRYIDAVFDNFDESVDLSPSKGILEVYKEEFSKTNDKASVRSYYTKLRQDKNLKQEHLSELIEHICEHLKTLDGVDGLEEHFQALIK